MESGEWRVESIAATKAKGSTTTALWMSELPHNSRRQILPEKRDLCYSFSIRSVQPRSRSLDGEAKGTDAFEPSAAVKTSSNTTGDQSAGIFFTPNGRNPLKSPNSKK